jgi:hypothetical protein
LVLCTSAESAPTENRATVIAACGAAQQNSNTGYVASLVLDRQVFALQAGCLLVRASLFRQAGGWARPLSDSLSAGIDLSVRMRASGMRFIWCAQTEAHSENADLDAAMEHTETDVGALRAQHVGLSWSDGNANNNLMP